MLKHCSIKTLSAFALFQFLSPQAASHKDRHISKLAITSLHDIMTELLSNRSELPHFWFHEALFKPFDGILSSTSCSEDDQEQVKNKPVVLQCTIGILLLKPFLESTSRMKHLGVLLNGMLVHRMLQ